jgi:hypothetical protein
MSANVGHGSHVMKVVRNQVSMKKYSEILVKFQLQSQKLNLEKIRVSTPASYTVTWPTGTKRRNRM